MKIILVATGANGKKVVFVSDTLRAYPLDEAVRLAKEGKFESVYAVNGKHGAYLRTLPRVPKEEELEALAVSPRQLFGFANDAGTALSHLALNQYLQLYDRALRKKEGGAFIVINIIAGVSHKEAKEKLQSHRKIIADAAAMFTVDSYLLGAIIIDEIARYLPFENILEELALFRFSKNVSAGIAQVTMETARGLIRDGYYNPNPRDSKLSPKNIGKTAREYLYEYVKQPRHNVFFAAAHMRAIVDHWKKFVDLNKRPEIIATLYSIGRGNPHRSPQASKRGLQIAGEFYQLARSWLL
jgi:hypothetical protein